MKYKFWLAFSLIELMVVIAIVAVLAAIAVPSYKEYLIKHKVMEAVNLLQRLSLDLQSEYTIKNAYPSSIRVNGVVISSPSWSIVNVGNIYGVSYTIGSPTNGVMLQASILGLTGISGYITPNPASIYSTKSTFSYSIVESNSKFTTYCGQYADTAAIPLNYLPSNCQCTNVSSGATC